MLPERKRGGPRSRLPAKLLAKPGELVERVPGAMNSCFVSVSSTGAFCKTRASASLPLSRLTDSCRAGDLPSVPRGH